MVIVPFRHRAGSRPRLILVALLLAWTAAAPAATEANAPRPAPAPVLAVAAAELTLDGFAVRVPGAAWQAQDAPGDVLLPAPVMAIRLGSGPWLGCGYLETAAAANALSVERGQGTVALDYRFADGGRYQVMLTAAGSVLLIDESAAMGPRDAWVFDAFYDWQPTAGIALSPRGATANFLYLPCHYDRVEATVLAHRPGPRTPAGLALLGDTDARPEILAVWARAVDRWQSPEQLPIQLWQRRQRGADVRSRHVLGPDTKCDGTPNPRTAGLLGTSLYEGHVTLECLLGRGVRRLALTVLARPEDRAGIVPALAGRMEVAP